MNKEIGQQGTGRRFDQEGTKPVEISPGRWHSRVMLGYKPNGDRNRISVTEDSPQAVMNEISRLRRQYQAGGPVVADGRSTLQEWLKYYLERAESLDLLAPNTIRGYVGKFRPHVYNTRLGKIRLQNLRAQHIEAQYQRMLKDGLAVTSVAQLHSALRPALRLAVGRGHIGVSPMEHVSVPRQSRDALREKKGPGDALSVEEAQAVLQAAQKASNPARWMFGLLLGIRQSEVLPVDWDDAVDLEAGTVRIFRKLYRKTWKHGCANSAGEVTCRKKRGADCPKRHSGGLFVEGTKTDGSARTVPLPGVLVTWLQELRGLHDRWARVDGYRSTWTTPDGDVLDLVFKQRNGRPVDARSDWGEWKVLLESAGVDRVRVHDMRHTAATMLLIQGVDSRVVMEIMGWSQVSMLKRYQHVVEHLQRDALDKVAGALESQPDPGPRPTGTSGVVVGLDAWKQQRRGL